VSELDDLVRNRRFDEIHEARQQVDDDKRELDDAVASGSLPDPAARRLWQRSIDRYVQQLEPILNPPTNKDKDRKTSVYWEDVTVGRIDLPDGTVREVNGLLEYLKLDERIGVDVPVETQDRYDELPRAEWETRYVQPSWDFLESAFRTANAALADLGMEIDPTNQSDVYTVKREPDEYDEPQKDSIPKPKK